MARRTAAHYRALLRRNPDATVGCALAASAVYASRYGLCEAQHHADERWKRIARTIRDAHADDLPARTVLTMLDRRTTGACIRSWLVAEGWTQREGAERAGMTPQQLNDLIADRHSPSVATLTKLAAAWGCELADLLPVHP